MTQCVLSYHHAPEPQVIGVTSEPGGLLSARRAGIFRPRFKPYVEVDPSAGAETQAIVLAVPG